MAPEAGKVNGQTYRNLYAFGATSFFNDTATEMAYWVLPAFLISIGAGPEKLGLIEGLSESLVSFTKLFSGYLADQVRRRKPIVVSGYVVANAVKPLLALVNSWWQVLLIRFADRFAKGVRGTPRDVMLAESVESGEVGSAFGLLQAMDSAGAIAGPLLALWILAHYSMRGVFWAAALPGALAMVVAAAGIRETKHGVRNSSTGIENSKITRRLPSSFYFVLSAVTLFSLANSSDMFLVLRAQNLGVRPVHAPLLGLVFNITYTLLSWPAGRLSDRIAKPRVAAAGYLVFAVVYAIFAIAPSLPVIWATMAFYGAYYALTNPVLRALVAETVSPEIRGRAFGIFYFLTGIATLLASIVTGELWKHYGAAVPFYLSAALAALAAVALLSTTLRSRRSHKASSLLERQI